MNADKQTETLRQVVAEVLERFAFSFAEEEDPQLQGTGWLLSDLIFTGPACGKVSLALSSELAAELGVNILGVDPDAVTPELAADTAKELSNIICGDLLFRLYGPQAVFDLRVPSLRMLATSQAVEQEIPADAADVKLSVEGHLILTWLTMESSPA